MTDTIINSISAASSLAGFIVSLYLIRKQTAIKPEEILKETKPVKKPKDIKFAVALALILFALFVFSGLRFRQSIKTEGQTGDFDNYAYGVVDIYYEKPFVRPPHLSFDRQYHTHSENEPRIVEQRKDGFKVTIGLGTGDFTWKAIGVLDLK